MVLCDVNGVIIIYVCICMLVIFFMFCYLLSVNNDIMKNI